MESSLERLERALGAAEAPLADAGFTESVMRSLPPKRFGVRQARQLTLAGAAGVGSALTLVLAEPVELLLAGYVMPGGLAMALIVATAFVVVFAAPVAWLIYSETKD